MDCLLLQKTLLNYKSILSRVIEWVKSNHLVTKTPTTFIDYRVHFEANVDASLGDTLDTQGPTEQIILANESPLIGNQTNQQTKTASSSLKVEPRALHYVIDERIHLAKIFKKFNILTQTTINSDS